ncbi:cyclic nucleotide-binding domain-containing protein [Candidatus Reidiella endopervernicosa]|uniref:cyclic nucleotide-binding domain-containing protein n=1 Tax=Candidatus Reidiella endopervernicosa TaxID=2738883 RepID=UPI002680F1E8|nr:cyclic nucleotide-binding domain-containing protein [Candidatus Reidiella endopervernicosa]
MSAPKEKKVVDLTGLNVACKDCSLHQLCLPTGISKDDMDRIDEIIRRRRPIARGETLFRAGDSFHSIYAVRSGSIKTYTPNRDGLEQVTGFHLPGEMVGLDAISDGAHPCTAKALETASLCEIPFDELEILSHGIPSLQRQLLKIMSREILHDHNLLM